MGSVWVAPGRPKVTSILVLVQANSPSQQISPEQVLLSLSKHLDSEKRSLPNCAR